MCVFCVCVCVQVGDVEAHEQLALALSRGLQLDTQRSSRDSLQCSSGYSTQSTTPCCSEDTIPSQGNAHTHTRTHTKHTLLGI